MNVQASLVDESTLSSFLPLVDSLTAVLKTFRRPVIVAGHGIRIAGVQDAFRDLISKWSVPVVTTFNGFDLLENDHPQYCGRIGTIGTRGGNLTLQNADGFLILGSRNNIRQSSYNWENLASRATKVIVDIDEAELKKPTVVVGFGGSRRLSTGSSLACAAVDS